MIFDAKKLSKMIFDAMFQVVEENRLLQEELERVKFSHHENLLKSETALSCVRQQADALQRIRTSLSHWCLE